MPPSTPHSYFQSPGASAPIPTGYASPGTTTLAASNMASWASVPGGGSRRLGPEPSPLKSPCSAGPSGSAGLRGPSSGSAAPEGPGDDDEGEQEGEQEGEPEGELEEYEEELSPRPMARSGSRKGQPKPRLDKSTDEWKKTRKDNHKEVERRRRETINDGISELKKIVPGTEKNKGEILRQAVKYIQHLKNAEASNIEKWTLEKLLTDQAMAEQADTIGKLTREVTLLGGEVEGLRRMVDSLGGDWEAKFPRRQLGSLDPLPPGEGGDEDARARAHADRRAAAAAEVEAAAEAEAYDGEPEPNGGGGGVPVRVGKRAAEEAHDYSGKRRRA